MRNVKIWIGSALGVVGVTAFVALRPGAERADATPQGPRELVAPAMVEPTGERIELAFEQPGHVAEVLVKEGDRVVAGQLLARLDDRLPRARVAHAEAALAAAQARRDAAFH